MKVFGVVIRVTVFDENIVGFDIPMRHRLYSAMQICQGEQTLMEDG
jgi:hypothetical protein